MGKFELIFGAFSAIIIILFMLAIVFAISYFSIKFFEKRTNQIWLLNTQAPQMSVFTRLFLKLNYLVYYLYVATILLIFSCGFWSRSGKTYDWSLMDNVIGKIIEPIRESLLSIFPYGDSEFVFFILFCSGVALLPFFIRMLYYYKKQALNSYEYMSP